MSTALTFEKQCNISCPRSTIDSTVAFAKVKIALIFTNYGNHRRQYSQLAPVDSARFLFRANNASSFVIPSFGELCVYVGVFVCLWVSLCVCGCLCVSVAHIMDMGVYNANFEQTMRGPLSSPLLALQRTKQLCMGWLRSVGSLKLHVSFAEYRLFYRALLQKRPTI